MERSSGVLLHVTSLPGRFGIGDLGPEAYRWIDALAGAKQRWWQVLPLVPEGWGNSPYSGSSAFGGNPLLISPQLLVTEGLLRRDELPKDKFREGRVNFAKVTQSKTSVLEKAWQNFKGGAAGKLKAEFEAFCHSEASWLDDLALFAALKEKRKEDWSHWPRKLASRQPAALEAARREMAEAIDHHRFVQFIFARQLTALRRHAKAMNVGIIGDLPIFVAFASVDVWANARLFKLDRNLQPSVVTGVPPDYFSATGQRWGNPHYDWRAMEMDGFAWWVSRVKATLRQVDLVRLDHFRGFEAAWEVPADCPTAQRGKWIKGPGEKFFAAIQKAVGRLPFIAEDLGLITPGVEKLRDKFALPGMRLLQFAFGGDAAHPFLPHHYRRNTVVYTGTHDNDTTAGWYRSLKQKEKKAIERYAPGAGKNIAQALTRLAWASVADLAVVPLQDVLGLGTKARMNVPGVANGNWTWRATTEQVRGRALDLLGELTQTYSRAD